MEDYSDYSESSGDEEYFSESSASTAPLANCVLDEDWEETIEILQFSPHWAEQQLTSEETFTVLWNDAPLEVIRLLLRAWPEAYQRKDEYGHDFVKTKLKNMELDFLDSIFEEFRHVTMPALSMKKALKYKPPQAFIKKYWKNFNILLYCILQRDWESTKDTINDPTRFSQQQFTRGAFSVLWSEAPIDAIRFLLQAWPEAHQEKDKYGRDFVSRKMFQEQWDILEKIFDEFPHVVKPLQPQDVIVHNPPPLFMKKYWKDFPILLHFIQALHWESTKDVLEATPDFPHEVIQRTDVVRILWTFAPLYIIRHILQGWPEAHQEKDEDGHNFVKTKILGRKWDFLETILDEFPQVASAAPPLDDAIQYKPPRSLTKKLWNENPSLPHCILLKDWQHTIDILKGSTGLAEIKRNIPAVFSSLWRDAPLDVVHLLFKAWPGVYRETDTSGRDFVERKVFAREWNFLDKTIEEFPDMEVLLPSPVKVVSFQPPLSFIHKHYGGNLFFTVLEKDWDKMLNILKNPYEIPSEDILTRQAVTALWADAPMEVIQLLFKIWPNVHEKENWYGQNLIESKRDNKDWDFLHALLDEFPQARMSLTPKAPSSVCDKYWNGSRYFLGSFSDSIQTRDWETAAAILEDSPDVAEEQISTEGIDVLWADGPIYIIELLFKILPNTYKEKDFNGRDFIESKLFHEEWGILGSFMNKFPNFVTEENVCRGVGYKIPLSLFGLMLNLRPNAPLKFPDFIFGLIDADELGYFQRVLVQCPEVVTSKDPDTGLPPLLYLFEQESNIGSEWVRAVLHANPDTAQDKDYDGKYPLHLAYQHRLSSDIVDMIYRAHPSAKQTKDNLGRLPAELANQAEKVIYTPYNKGRILKDGISDVDGSDSPDIKTYPNNAVVVCRRDMLLRDLSLDQQKNEDLRFFYSQQVLARQRIFDMLLDEFSKMVGVADKDIIQKAATIQALAAEHLSQKNDSIIDFDSMDDSGYWYQQEILKMVIRVHHESRFDADLYVPSMKDDAYDCLEELEKKRIGDEPSRPSELRIRSFEQVVEWLTKGLDNDLFSLRGPVLKPLQSLFNKLFIRRGQTTVHVIGDLVRGTLMVRNKETLRHIVKHIETSFPNIGEGNFQHPDKFDHVADFLDYVHDHLKYLPGSDVLPYRFKMNSSQTNKQKEAAAGEPLWFNLNFFHKVPEFYRVGTNEMFVACELQIGLDDEIKSHRTCHDAYERDRILSHQPLLKNYLSAMEGKLKDGHAAVKIKTFQDDDEEKKSNEEKSGTNYVNSEDGNDDINNTSRLCPTNCSINDINLMNDVLTGTISSEILIPCGNDVVFHTDAFSLSWLEASDERFLGNDGLIDPSKRKCINNRNLIRYACTNNQSLQLGGPFGYILDEHNDLDPTKRYFVESLIVRNLYTVASRNVVVGTYARVGSHYLVEVACREIDKNIESYGMVGQDLMVVESGCNFTFLEQICPLPAGTRGVEIMIFDQTWTQFKHSGIDLVLRQFDV